MRYLGEGHRDCKEMEEVRIKKKRKKFIVGI